MRRVVGGERLQGSVHDGLHEGRAVRRRSQRRVHLVIRVAFFDVGVGERKVMGCEFAGNFQAACPRFADQPGAFLRGDVLDVDRAAGAAREIDVAADDLDLRLGRDARKFPMFGKFALVHDAALFHFPVLRVIHDRLVQRGRQRHRALHRLVGRHRGPVVREHARAGFHQRLQVGDLAAVAARRDARGGNDPDQADLLGATDHLRHALRRVERRLRIGHGDDRREPAARRGARTGLDRFRILAAGLAKMNVQVNQPRHNHEPRRLDHLRARRYRRWRLHNHSILDEEIPDSVCAGGGIDDLAAPDVDGFVHSLTGFSGLFIAVCSIVAAAVNSASGTACSVPQRGHLTLFWSNAGGSLMFNPHAQAIVAY